MNWQRGLLRVWVVGSLVWFVGWIIYIAATCELKHVPGDAEGVLTTLCYTGFSGWMTQYGSFTALDYASIAASGLSVPAAALLAGIGISWAVNGFHAGPRSKD
jgi:hypothetical protein